MDGSDSWEISSSKWPFDPPNGAHLTFKRSRIKLPNWVTRKNLAHVINLDNLSLGTDVKMMLSVCIIMKYCELSSSVCCHWYPRRSKTIICLHTCCVVKVLNASIYIYLNLWSIRSILLMEEILHQLVRRIYHNVFKVFIYLRWLAGFLRVWVLLVLSLFSRESPFGEKHIWNKYVALRIHRHPSYGNTSYPLKWHAERSLKTGGKLTS